MNRDELIALCEKAIVNESLWSDRDSSSAQRQIGELWALLKAGCEFKLEKNESPGTHSVLVRFNGFSHWVWDKTTKDEDVFYLPTEAKLERANGGDWY
jgi:hypothetical protein